MIARAWMIVLFIALSVPGVTHATTYWVSATGGSTGNCGSAQGASDPGVYLRTINAGVACVSGSGGDTLLVKDGTYTWTTSPRGGSSPSSRNTYKSVNGQGARIVASTQYGANLFVSEDNVRVEGFLFDGAGYQSSGVGTTGANVQLVNNEVKSTTFAAAISGAGVNTEFIGNYVHDNGKGAGCPCTPKNTTGNCGAVAADDCHALYVGGTGLVFDGNRVHDQSGWAFHLRPGCTNCTIRNNEFTDIFGDGIGIVGGSGNLVYNNVGYATVAGGFANGSGDQWYQNTFHNISAHGISVRNGNVAVRNNIFSNTGNPTVDQTPATATNNLCTSAGTGCQLISNPNFVNAPGGDFHLNSGSPAINAGFNLAGTVDTDADGCQRPVGSAWDIGAYEFGATGCGPGPTPGAPSFTFTCASPVDSGQTTSCNWSAVTDATSCTASVPTGTDATWTGSQSLSGGSFTSTALTSPRTYRLSCTGAGGTTAIDQPITVTPIPIGRVSWLKLDGNTVDSDGGFTDTATGGVSLTAPPLIDSDPVTPGMQGNSALFDGINGAINGPNTAAFRPSRLCLATWMAMPTRPGAGTVDRMMSLGVGSTATAAVGVRDDGLPFFTTNNGAGLFGPAVVDGGSNHLIVGSYDGNVARLWVDNANVDSTNTGTTPLSYTGSEILSIGGVSDRFYTGRLENVRFKDEPCSSSDVAQYFNENVPVLAGVQSTHCVFTAANQPEGTGFSAENTSISQLLTLPRGVRCNIKRNGSSITEYFPLYARVKPLTTGVWGAWTALTNSLGSLGVAIATDTAVDMGDATTVRLPTGGFISTAGRIIADTINTSLKTTVADGNVSEWEARVAFGTPLVTGDQVQFKFYRENDTAFDAYPASDDLLPTITLTAPLPQATKQGVRLQGGIH